MADEELRCLLEGLLWTIPRQEAPNEPEPECAAERGSTDPDALARASVPEPGKAQDRPVSIRPGNAEQLSHRATARQGHDGDEKRHKPSVRNRMLDIPRHWLADKLSAWLPPLVIAGALLFEPCAALGNASALPAASSWPASGGWRRPALHALVTARPGRSHRDPSFGSLPHLAWRPKFGHTPRGAVHRALVAAYGSGEAWNQVGALSYGKAAAGAGPFRAGAYHAVCP
jgi:hypothetical protein